MLITLWAGVGWADTFTVEPGGLSLEEALAIAATGDTVAIGKGTYFVSNALVPHGVLVVGAGIEDTVIAPTNTETVAALQVLNANDVEIRDLTLATSVQARALLVSQSTVVVEDVLLNSRGVAGKPVPSGALVFVQKSQATFRNTTFVGSTGFVGGAMWAQTSTVLVEDSRFSSGEALFFGGAVASELGNATFLRTEFTDNAAHRGGAIEFNGGPDHTLRCEQCTFINNHAVHLSAEAGNANGGAIHARSGRVEIVGSTFSGNSAAVSGGAMNLEASPNALISDSVFVGNGSTVAGGAISTVDTVSLHVVRNGFTDHQSFVGGTLYVGGRGTSVVEGNRSCDTTATWGGTMAFLQGKEPLSGHVNNNIVTLSDATDLGSAIFVQGAEVSVSQNTLHGEQSTTAAAWLDGYANVDLLNNAFVHFPGGAIDPSSEVASAAYNLMWADPEPVVSPDVAVVADPQFDDDEVGCDATFRPLPTSPLVDGGDPTLLDDDGSRSDIGALGGPGASALFDIDGDGVIEGDCAPYDNSLTVATEEVVADGQDQDCDGLDLCYTDADGDGVGIATLTPGDCTEPGLSDRSDDCDDSDASRTDDCDAPAPPTHPPGWFCSSTGSSTAMWLLAATLLGARRRRLSA